MASGTKLGILEEEQVRSTQYWGSQKRGQKRGVGLLERGRIAREMIPRSDRTLSKGPRSEHSLCLPADSQAWSLGREWVPLLENRAYLCLGS